MFFHISSFARENPVHRRYAVRVVVGYNECNVLYLRAYGIEYTASISSLNQRCNVEIALVDFGPVVLDSVLHRLPARSPGTFAHCFDSSFFYHGAQFVNQRFTMVHCLSWWFARYACIV